MRYSNPRRFQRRKKQNSPHKLFKVIGVVFLFIVLQGYYYNYLVASNQTLISFEIQSGENLNHVSSKLKDLNIIQSEFLFKRYLSKNEYDKKIKSGNFEIPTQINIKNLALILIDSPTQSSKITIIEGEKISQIESKNNFSNLNQCISNCNIENFFEDYNINTPSTLEGFLFPDTYFISSNENYQSLIKKSLNNFKNKTKNLDLGDYSNLPVKNFYEVLIVASLIEKEVILEQDKALVSGIIYKRLENQWTLGIDAALLYEKDNNKITYEDLNSNSPYNLRKIKGLPPTPICNPSLSSIQAALNPKNSNYWFYLTKPITNEVVYSKTNQEHNLNKRKFLN
ncbi:hypothetical protein CL656_04255 [bacterium]|nr:hypothetical protein [bacterium]|tara:strand:- start:164 stop:1183 length:1020 start_codon:yes stop_codon:yes gene_type:complete